MKIKKKSELQEHLEKMGKANNGEIIQIKITTTIKKEINALNGLSAIIKKIGVTKLKKMYEEGD